MINLRAPRIPNSIRLYLLLAFAGALTPLVYAQQDERAVRAAYVFNLTKYVTWPTTRDKLSLRVMGEPGIASVLKSVLDNKTSDGRAIKVAIDSPDSPLGDCDVLYLGGLSPAAVKSILDKTSGKPILTVGDSDRFVRSGGMIALVRSGDQIEIEINLATLRSRHLDVSSRLLNIAVIVSQDGGRR